MDNQWILDYLNVCLLCDFAVEALPDGQILWVENICIHCDNNQEAKEDSPNQ